jgi:hypothetical protein
VEISRLVSDLKKYLRTPNNPLGAPIPISRDGKNFIIYYIGDSTFDLEFQGDSGEEKSSGLYRLIVSVEKEGNIIGAEYNEKIQYQQNGQPDWDAMIRRGFSYARKILSDGK